MSTDTRNAMEKAFDETLAVWADPDKIASQREVGKFGTRIVVRRDHDPYAFTILRFFPIAGDWQVSVDLESANDWEVFDYLLELADENA